MINYRAPLDELPDPLPIEPLREPFDVTITPPGSKSITCRAYVLAALADGESKIIRPLRADDTDRLLDALCTLGAVARWDGEDVYIKGVAGRFPRGGEVNLGDGGTPTRFMIACACLAKEPVIVDGSKRMRERPIAEGVDMLRQLGATIDYVEEEGRLPVRVVPSEKFKGGTLSVGRTQSSQFLSALLLIAAWTQNGITVNFLESVTSWDYVYLTWSVLRDWDIPSTQDVLFETENHLGVTEREHGELAVRISPRYVVKNCTYKVAADASSATYWYFAAAMMPRSRITISGLCRNNAQPDNSLLLHIEDMGAKVDPPDWNPGSAIDELLSLPDQISIEGTQRWEPFGIDAEGTPDGSMVFAVASATGNQPVRITGLHTLRVKETDRIAALANELRKVGCEVETTDGSITITPIPRDGTGQLIATHPVEIETYNDHRMAMAFAVLGLVRPGISIRNPACVRKSYPTFWQDFAKLYENPRRGK